MADPPVGVNSITGFGSKLCLLVVDDNIYTHIIIYTSVVLVREREW